MKFESPSNINQETPSKEEAVLLAELEAEQNALEQDEAELEQMRNSFKVKVGKLLKIGYGLATIFTLLTGIISEAKAEEYLKQDFEGDGIELVDDPPDKVINDIVDEIANEQEHEKQIEINPVVQEFVDMSEQERIEFLDELIKKEERWEIYQKKIDEEGKVISSSSHKVEESGMRQAGQLKEDLENLLEKDDNYNDDNEMYQAFLAVHKYILENMIVSGEQMMTVWNTDNNDVHIGEFLNRIKAGKGMFDKNDLDEFFEAGASEGEQLQKFMEKIKGISGSELSKIKQIYDLVATEVPFYKWYGEENQNKYQTFEQLLDNNAGVCTEKNALLVYCLRQAGFEAELWGFTGHIMVRVFTSEGVLEIDVTNSDSFSITKQLKTNCVYTYSTGGQIVNLELNSEENIEKIAQRYHLPVGEIERAISQIKNVKPHPLYELAKQGQIFSETAGKYSKDLFPQK